MVILGPRESRSQKLKTVSTPRLIMISLLLIQAMAKKKEQSRNPLEKLIGQDNVFRLFDKQEKSPQMGMHSSQSGQTPDQANQSFDSVSTLAGTETKAKNDESIVTDDFSLSSSSSE